MTRRERLERKLEKREEWANGREQKAGALLKRNEPYRGDIAFNTQPGHIPERARAIARSDKAFEHTNMANHHRSKAAGLEDQLERTIFDDDRDAIERLTARVEEREQASAHMKAVNAAIRKARKAHPEPAALLASLVRDGTISEQEAKRLASNFAIVPYNGLGYPSYALTNNSANIRRDRQRIEAIKAQAVQHAEVEQSPDGVLVTEHGSGYCSVQFAEKPDRSVINALKEAGFRWSKTRWYGYVSKLPACVRK